MKKKNNRELPDDRYPHHFYTAMQLDGAAQHLQKLVGKRLKLSVKRCKHDTCWSVRASLSNRAKLGPLAVPRTARVHGVLVTQDEGSRFYYTTRPHQRALRTLLLLLYVALAVCLLIVNNWNALAAFGLLTVVAGLVFFPMLRDIAFGQGGDNQLAHSIRLHLRGTARAFMDESRFAPGDSAGTTPAPQQEEA